GNLVPVAVSENQRAEVRLTPFVRSLTVGGGKPGQGYPAVLIPYSVSPESGQGAHLRATEIDVAPALTATAEAKGTDRGTRIVTYAGVRRLTPRECERLQGFPDDWTLLDDAGEVIADTHRYRFMGNAVTVPVVEWIGRRIRMAAASDRHRRAS